ncbi:hypothetical protein LSAT2_016463 [Lamellibrachia satsuma]|nr:hypothetical protein LSAT2_016463 [Lamellibrachia satsuma]
MKSVFANNGRMVHVQHMLPGNDFLLESPVQVPGALPPETATSAVQAICSSRTDQTPCCCSNSFLTESATSEHTFGCSKSCQTGSATS